MTFGNLGRALDIVAEIRGDEVSLIQGKRQLTWTQVGRRAGNIAAWMVECGASRQGKVAIYTDSFPASHVIRQITLRMTTWLNFITAG